MQTKILTINQIDEAVDLLKKGQLVALPTETVYGLAADACNPDAIKKVFVAKGRPSDHPLILHIDSFEKLCDWVEDVPENAKLLADHFWPGPLTMIFKKKAHVDPLITGGLNTLAVRVPHHPVMVGIIKKLGTAVVAPSANAYKKISPTKPDHVLNTLNGKIAAVVDGGASSVGIESTIIDMTKDIPVILRFGVITVEMIEAILGIKIDAPLHHNQKVSGNVKDHYQPEKPLLLLSLDQIDALIQQEPENAVIYYSDLFKGTAGKLYKMPFSKTEYAQKLYDVLHQADNTQVHKILVEMPPNVPEWADVIDRLIKASQK